MDYRYKQLEQELSALSKLFGELGARLSEVAKEITTPGVTPPEKLIAELTAARTNFDNVRAAVHGHAGSMLVSPLPKLVEVASVAAIDTLLKAAAVAEETKYSTEGEREKALSILSRVLAITHREIADFKPLQECHATVSELRNGISKTVWPHRHPESESIIGMKHPATALLSFVENLDTLDDERWMAFETTITESYGKPLFVAASRGKLVAPAAGKPAAPAVEKPVEKKAAPEASAPPAPVVEKAPEKKPTPVAALPVEKKETVVVQKPAPVPAPVVPATVVPPPPAPAVVAPAAVAQTPIAAASVAPAPAAVSAPAAPAPAPPVTAAPATPAPRPAPVVQTTTTTINSLTALATATEPAVERKPAVAPPPADQGEKQRKEPRLASPAPQPIAKIEAKPQESPMMNEDQQRMMAGDGSQRPQRWGFWRGNR